jgi:D-aminopeptidase
METPRPRLRQIGLIPGILPTGLMNAITDVQGVRVGHFTLIQGDAIRTGGTAILAHPGNLYQDKVPAGLAVGNGYGKLMASTQIDELGEIETPILLTNTLAVAHAAEAILDWTLRQPGNETVASVNPVVGETNDSYLNDIRSRPLTSAMLRVAIEQADSGPVVEGAVGAGTGTTAFGWKGGIGSSSRRLPEALGGYTLGALVQSNFGGVLQMCGIPVGQALGQYTLKDQLDEAPAQSGGSIMMVLATDAPLSDRNLRRLAWRALGGLARTGAALGNNSGDYAIAFSTSAEVRRTPTRRSTAWLMLELPNDLLNPLFLAAIEATEEAIYNSLLQAVTVRGYQGHTAEALPVDEVIRLVKTIQSGRNP